MTITITSVSPALVENAKGGEQSQKVAVMTKVQLYGKPVAVVQGNDKLGDKVDTSALFVATPDGKIHRRVVTKDGVQYEPTISHNSYNTGLKNKR